MVLLKCLNPIKVERNQIVRYLFVEKSYKIRFIIDNLMKALLCVQQLTKKQANHWKNGIKQDGKQF